MHSGETQTGRDGGDCAERLVQRCTDAGFLLVGGFHPVAADQVPVAGSAQQVTRSLLLIGNAGASLWRHFRMSPEFADGQAEPLDRYTRRVLSAIAEDFGMGVFFACDGPPYHPFQRWAMKAGGFSQSPLGVLVHRTYGPWAALRAAFLSPEEVRLAPSTAAAGPCQTCADKPCLSACPAGAVSLSGGYDVPRCSDHIAVPSGQDCLSGCLARRACPYGQEHRQGPDQALFHMRSFLRLVRG